MSVIDKALAAITPQSSEERRAEATKKSRAAASPGDCLSMALDHHEQIRSVFAEGRKTRTAADRRAAMERLALVLNGHSLAEEIVLYPAMAKHGHKMQAGVAYSEQTTAKMQMAELETIAGSSNAWFIHLKDKGERQDHLTVRYKGEFERYAGAR